MPNLFPEGVDPFVDAPDSSFFPRLTSDDPVVEVRCLMRTKHGTMIHHDSCAMTQRKNSKARPWLWANRVPLAEVHSAILFFDYRCCRKCLPFGVRGIR